MSKKYSIYDMQEIASLKNGNASQMNTFPLSII